MPYSDKEKRAAYAAAYYLRNKEKIAQQTNARYVANKEKRAAYHREHHSKIRVCRNAEQRAYYAANREKQAAYRRANSASIKKGKAASYARNKDTLREVFAKHYIDNKSRYSIRSRSKYALLKMQYEALSVDEKWLLQEAYLLAKLREKVCGGKWEVDHIVPLSKGGLHSPHNVQVVPAYWNRSKHASHSKRFFGAQE